MHFLIELKVWENFLRELFDWTEKMYPAFNEYLKNLLSACKTMYFYVFVSLIKKLFILSGVYLNHARTPLNWPAEPTVNW